MYITGGRIFTMAGQVFENGTIRIEDGKIREVKEGAIGDMPSGKTKKVLDVQGAWVLPGLIEAHCHMGITEQKKGMEGDDCNENVSPVTPWLRAVDAINPMDAAFADAVRAGITSAMIGPGSSNVVGGQFAFVKTFGRCLDDLIVKAPAAMKVAFGENPKMNFSGQGQSPVTRMGIAGILREELFHAKQYLEKGKRVAANLKKRFKKSHGCLCFWGKFP